MEWVPSVLSGDLLRLPGLVDRGAEVVEGLAERGLGRRLLGLEDGQPRSEQADIGAGEEQRGGPSAVRRFAVMVPYPAAGWIEAEPAFGTSTTT